jgi:hypothetical protein
MPSAVLIAPNGAIFVADGHGGNSNARVLKFAKDGRLIKTWGKKGSGRSSVRREDQSGIPERHHDWQCARR